MSDWYRQVHERVWTCLSAAGHTVNSMQIHVLLNPYANRELQNWIEGAHLGITCHHDYNYIGPQVRDAPFFSIARTLRGESERFGTVDTFTTSLIWTIQAVRNQLYTL